MLSELGLGLGLGLSGKRGSSRGLRFGNANDVVQRNRLAIDQNLDGVVDVEDLAGRPGNELFGNGIAVVDRLAHQVDSLGELLKLQDLSKRSIQVLNAFQDRKLRQVVDQSFLVHRIDRILVLHLDRQQLEIINRGGLRCYRFHVFLSLKQQCSGHRTIRSGEQPTSGPLDSMNDLRRRARDGRRPSHAKTGLNATHTKCPHRKSRNRDSPTR